jgi:signal transduction histidine kinase
MRKQIKSVNENWNPLVKKKTNELQIANQELLLHDKLQKDFINVAAHELRTPIMPILGLSEFLYEKILNKNLKKRNTQRKSSNHSEKFFQVTYTY